MAPNSMMAISANLTHRMRPDFSYLSASCPAVAENRKNGRIKMPAASVTSSLPSIPAFSARRYRIRMAIALRKKLSLAAPRKKVMSSGRNRFVFRRCN